MWTPASWSRRASGRLSTRKSTSKLGTSTSSRQRMTSSSWQMAKTRTPSRPLGSDQQALCVLPSDSLQTFPCPNDDYTPLRSRSFRRALLILVLPASPVAPQGRTAPCAECVTLVIEPREANSFSGPLNGARIAVKIRAGAEHTAFATLSDIRDTGGRPGPVVTGLPSQPLAAEPIRMAKDVFLDITSLETEAPLPIDETAF